MDVLKIQIFSELVEDLRDLNQTLKGTVSVEKLENLAISFSSNSESSLNSVKSFLNKFEGAQTIEIETLVLYLYRSLANILNISDLYTEKVKGQSKITDEHIGASSILSTLRSADRSSASSQKYVNVLGISFGYSANLQAFQYDSASQTVLIPLQSTVLALLSNGNYDLKFTAALCHTINTNLKLKLCPFLLVKENSSEKYVENFSVNFQKETASYERFTVEQAQEFYKSQRDLWAEILEKGDSAQDISSLRDSHFNKLSEIVFREMKAPVSRVTHYLEQLLILLLGFPIDSIRDRSIYLLNYIYDGIEWGTTRVEPVITTVGQEIIIDEITHIEQLQSSGECYYIEVHGLQLFQGSSNNLTRLYNVQAKPWECPDKKQGARLTFNFGKATRSGFLDWRIVSLDQDSNLNGVYEYNGSQNLQGRFIVHPEDVKTLQFHETTPDYPDGISTQDQSTYYRGGFADLKGQFNDYFQSGVNCLYLTGAFERDNQPEYDQVLFQQIYRRPEAGLIAYTSRDRPNSMLGGENKFRELMDHANNIGLKVLVDCIGRVSSSRYDTKYQKLIIREIDNLGRETIAYGAPGRSINFEETMWLNYRKQKSWDLLIDELFNIKKNFKVSGIHIDDGQDMPPIFKLDAQELLRKDYSNKPIYNQQEILSGAFVRSNELSGYWGSDYREIYANPFYNKLCRTLWGKYPDFIIVSEVWGRLDQCETEERNIICSGPIPRVFDLPQLVSQILNEQIHKDGRIERCGTLPCNALSSYLHQYSEHLPIGSIRLSSTAYYAFPYLTLLLKRGAWAALDTFFFLPDIPITFMGQQKGWAFKIQSLKISSVSYINQTSSNMLTPQHKSLNILKNIFLTERESSNNEGPSPMKPGKVQKIKEGEEACLFNEQDVNNIIYNQRGFREEVGPQFGFDLDKIHMHYQSLRAMRHTYKSLQQGKYIALLAEHKYGIHDKVLAYARFTREEITVIVTNFNDGPVDSEVSLRKLSCYFEDYRMSDIVAKIDNLMMPQETPVMNNYFIGELLLSPLIVHLENFKTKVFCIKLFDDEKSRKNALSHTLFRLKEHVKSNKIEVHPTNQIVERLANLILKSENLNQFLQGYVYLHQNFISDLSLSGIVNKYSLIRNNKQLTSQLICILNAIEQCGEKIPEIKELLPFFNDLKGFLNETQMGPIVVAAPEFGPWTKTGGLGVIVYDLCVALAALGEKVVVVTPYYEKNIDGKTGYLGNQFQYLMNLDIMFAGAQYTLGIHHGTHKGMEIYWMHNSQMFPAAFEGNQAQYVLRQMTLYAQGTLELLCQVQCIPDLIVTNDWFSGLIPAYVNSTLSNGYKKYSNTFDNTQVYHIFHNLDPSYEGRLWPKREEGTLDNIHELPSNLLRDPYWQDCIINPSRCATITCDNWGTVSHSYKHQLLRESPLAGLLSQKPYPFSYPNGLLKNARMKGYNDKLRTLYPQDYEQFTYSDHIQCQEFLQKNYFGCDFDNEKIIFGFIGRITEQKGVHLICNVAEDLINGTGGRVQIIVGGNYNPQEQYGADCAARIYDLKNRYPRNFWGDPNSFFKDGPVLCIGSDFGLMPSQFEPGGIVQHEFFLGKTPVVAFKTGGLQDTVKEYNKDGDCGTGFVFQSYNEDDMKCAMGRAMNVYKSDGEYKQLRELSANGVIEFSEVTKAYIGEFYRMCNKFYIDKELVDKNIKKFEDSKIDFEKLKAVEDGNNLVQMVRGHIFDLEGESIIRFNQLAGIKKKVTINISQQADQGIDSIMQITGTFFDNWNQKVPMVWNVLNREWGITLELGCGEYYYQFYQDGNWIYNENEIQTTDLKGIPNNHLFIS